MKRKTFLNDFLGALGAVQIEWHYENDDFISGKVIYKPDDSEEVQEFRWHKTENEVPPENVRLLAKLLRNESFLSIDKIIVTRKELANKYNDVFGVNYTEQEFIKILKILESIEVPMLDNGEETDMFFIHE